MKAMLAAVSLSLALVTVGAPAATASRASHIKAVVRMWSAYLNANDNEKAARLFALPAIVIQAPYEFRLRTRKELVEWHSTLPCAGYIVSIAVKGETATVVFQLGDRPRSTCTTPGAQAAARFTFVDGKIVRWEQIAVPKAKATGPTA